MRWKQIGKALLFPPIWVMIVLMGISAAVLIVVFVKGLEQSPLAYISYVLAFYTLSVVCAFFAMALPKRYKEIQQKVYDHPIGNRYMSDAAFRTHVLLYASLGINLLYVGVNVLSFVRYRSMWFVVLAGYYSILSTMRFLLARDTRGNGIGQNRLGELKSVTVCASLLLTVNFALSGAVLMILYQNKGFTYPGTLIYVMAAYTFYITTHAIIDLVKYRRLGSPVMTMTKVIALSAALVSMLSLETAMLSQFGKDMSPENKRLMIILTGAGVGIVVVTMSVYMIVRSVREINTLRGNKNGK